MTVKNVLKVTATLNETTKSKLLTKSKTCHLEEFSRTPGFDVHCSLPSNLSFVRMIRAFSAYRFGKPCHFIARRKHPTGARVVFE